ncbi:hypothetical protein L228DRAFT_243534, partial [Xylona heveae TC161]
MVIVIILGLGLLAVLLSYFHRRYKRRQQKARAPQQVSLWYPPIGGVVNGRVLVGDMFYIGTATRTYPEDERKKQKKEKKNKKTKNQVLVAENEVGVSGPSSAASAGPAGWDGADSEKKLMDEIPIKDENM